MKKEKGPLTEGCKKGTALFVAVLFTFTTVAWSASTSFSIETRGKNREIQALPFIDEIIIPESLARVDDKYIPAPASSRSEFATLVHIQDAHSSYEAQNKIKELLQHLTKNHGFKLILLEGGSGKLNPDLLRFFGDKALNAKFVDSLAQKAEVGGAELFLVDSGSPTTAFGIEDEKLYWTNLLNFRRAMARTEESDTFLLQAKNALSILGSHYFNQSLRDFLKEWLFFRDSHTELLRHLEALERAALEELNLDLTDPWNQRDWPNLIRVLKLKEIEKQMDVQAAKREKERLFSWSQTKKIDKEFSEGIEAFFDPSRNHESRKEPRKFLERFYEKAKPSGFQFKDYPALSHYLAFYTLQNEIDVRGLISETEKLTDLILEKLAQTEQEKTLVTLLKDQLILRKLFSLDLTRREFDQITGGRERFLPSRYAQRILGLGNGKTKIELGRLPEMDEIFGLALAFYEGTLKRDDAMLENSLRIMRKQGETKAVLVTGGFHSEGLKARFREKEIAYLEVSPKVSKVESENNYLKAIMAEIKVPSTGKSKIKSRLYLNSSPAGGRTAAELARSLQEVGFSPRDLLRASAEEVLEDPRFDRLSAQDKVQKALDFLALQVALYRELEISDAVLDVIQKVRKQTKAINQIRNSMSIIIDLAKNSHLTGFEFKLMGGDNGETGALQVLEISGPAMRRARLIEKVPFEALNIVQEVLQLAPQKRSLVTTPKPRVPARRFAPETPRSEVREGDLSKRIEDRKLSLVRGDYYLAASGQVAEAWDRAAATLTDGGKRPIRYGKKRVRDMGFPRDLVPPLRFVFEYVPHRQAIQARYLLPNGKLSESRFLFSFNDQKAGLPLFLPSGDDSREIYLGSIPSVLAPDRQDDIDANFVSRSARTLPQEFLWDDFVRSFFPLDPDGSALPKEHFYALSPAEIIPEEERNGAEDSFLAYLAYGGRKSPEIFRRPPLKESTADLFLVNEKGEITAIFEFGRHEAGLTKNKWVNTAKLLAENGYKLSTELTLGASTILWRGMTEETVSESNFSHLAIEIFSELTPLGVHRIHLVQIDGDMVASYKGPANIGFVHGRIAEVLRRRPLEGILRRIVEEVQPDFQSGLRRAKVRKMEEISAEYAAPAGALANRGRQTSQSSPLGQSLSGMPTAGFVVPRSDPPSNLDTVHYPNQQVKPSGNGTPQEEKPQSFGVENQGDQIRSENRQKDLSGIVPTPGVESHAVKNIQKINNSQVIISYSSKSPRAEVRGMPVSDSDKQFDADLKNHLRERMIEHLRKKIRELERAKEEGQDVDSPSIEGSDYWEGELRLSPGMGEDAIRIIANTQEKIRRAAVKEGTIAYLNRILTALVIQQKEEKSIAIGKLYQRYEGFMEELEQEGGLQGADTDFLLAFTNALLSTQRDLTPLVDVEYMKKNPESNPHHLYRILKKELQEIAAEVLGRSGIPRAEVREQKKERGVEQAKKILGSEEVMDGVKKIRTGRAEAEDVKKVLKFISSRVGGSPELMWAMRAEYQDLVLEGKITRKVGRFTDPGLLRKILEAARKKGADAGVLRDLAGRFESHEGERSIGDAMRFFNIVRNSKPLQTLLRKKINELSERQRSEVRLAPPAEAAANVRETLDKAAGIYNPRLNSSNRTEVVLGVARDALYQILAARFLDILSRINKNAYAAVYQEVLDQVMPEKARRGGRFEIPQDLSGQDKAALEEVGILPVPGRVPDNTFGLSIVPADTFTTPDLVFTGMILSRYPNKLLVVAVKGKSEEELRSLNEFSKENLEGRVLIIPMHEQGYAKTVDDLFRGDRKEFPQLEEFRALANGLANKAGRLGTMTLKDLGKYASIAGTSQALKDNLELFPRLNLLQSRLIDENLDQIFKGNQANRLSFIATISLMVAGIDMVRAEYLRELTARNLDRIDEIDPSRFNATFAPQINFITSLAHLRDAAEALAVAA